MSTQILTINAGDAPVDVSAAASLGLSAGTKYTVQVLTGILKMLEAADAPDAGDDSHEFQESRSADGMPTVTPDATNKPWMWTLSPRCKVAITEA